MRTPGGGREPRKADGSVIRDLGSGSLCFYHLNKIPKTTNAHGCGHFSPGSLALHIGHLVTQHMVEQNYSLHNQEVKEKEKGLGTMIPFEDTPPMT
jgi:hypothetical protein